MKLNLSKTLARFEVGTVVLLKVQVKQFNKSPTLLALLDPADGGSTFLRNVETFT